MEALPADPSQSVDFSRVFKELGPFVWRALRRLGVREADVEDACQEVFVVVHRKLAGFEGRSSVRTWVYGIAIRVAADHRRRAYVRRERITEPPEQIAEPSQSLELEQAEGRAMLDAALEVLDDDKRAVFVLYEIEELTMAEVASALGCPLQTAYSRLHAARRIVEEAVRERAGAVQ